MNWEFMFRTNTDEKILWLDDDKGSDTLSRKQGCEYSATLNCHEHSQTESIVQTKTQFSAT